MLNLLPLSPKGCLYRQWVPPEDLMFLKRRAWLPLHRREVVEASSTMPLAVARVGKQQWRLVALCGIFKQHNVWVQQGQWVGRYRPQCLDTLPFEYLSVQGRGVVAFDIDSGLEAEAGQGVPFFTPLGDMHPEARGYVDLVMQRYPDYRELENVLGLFDKLELLVPWESPWQDRAGVDIECDGLFRVDEHAVSRLSHVDTRALYMAQAVPVISALGRSFEHVKPLVHAALSGEVPFDDGNVPQKTRCG
ncbi:SapC family protein [Vreelandella stevensii]|uniref:SapC family protein n=1 Tax=Vreelandella stevensii TaxID=502821 RepID=UPI00374915D8